jgi:hypothetical protein
MPPDAEVIEPQVLPRYPQQGGGMNVDTRQILKSPFFWFAAGGVFTGILILLCIKHAKK